MKITALRVQSFRRFDKPVAVEGIGDGVNVLAGPNEMGKSTLYMALEAAFLYRHRSTGPTLEKMRPHSGGEPVVEADFCAGGKSWRLRKQFGRGANMVLSELVTGRIAARAGDAEALLSDLLGRKDDQPGRFGLIWIKQQKSLESPVPDFGKLRGERQALLDAISREIEKSAVGDGFDFVRSRTYAARDMLITAARLTPKKNGPLDVAIRALEEARGRLADAEKAADLSRHRSLKLSTLSQELQALKNVKQQHEIEKQIADHEEQITSAANSRAQHALAVQKHKAAQSNLVAAKQTLEAHRALAERRRQLTEARARAAELTAAVAEMSQHLNEEAMTPARFDRLLQLNQELNVVSATLEAEAASVDIALKDTHGGRLRIDGKPVDSNRAYAVDESLDISIADIADIRVALRNRGGAAKAAVRKQAIMRELQDLMLAGGVTSLEQAKQRATFRANLVERLDQTRAQLLMVASKGPEQIDTEIAELDQRQPEAAREELLVASVREAQQAFLWASNELEALESVTVGDEAFRKLSAELATLKVGAEDRRTAIAKRSLAIENLKGEQAGADEAGLAGRVDEFTEIALRAEADVKRLQEEVSALNLLAATLDRIEASARGAFHEPVSRRLEPLLKLVFGSAKAGFNGELIPDTLTRDGMEEDITELSDGTREQLSVLVRLSFAELLAERGYAAPMIMDDPLVYSDDQRLQKMCAAIAYAGQRLQVLLLTCRPSAFQSLPGRRIEVTGWRPD